MRRLTAMAEYIELMQNSKTLLNSEAFNSDDKHRDLIALIAYTISLCYPESGTLFRYRRLNDNTISALENDELWFSGAKTFNDDFDSRCYINEDVLAKNIIKLLGEREGLPIQYLPKSFDKIAIAICEKYKELYIDLERNTKIVCFSEDINSKLMWGHYAESGKGFAVEYNIDDILETVKTVTPIVFPIIYNNSAYNATLDTIDLFHCLEIDPQIRLDPLMMVNPAINKTSEWSYEKEWRLIGLGLPESDSDFTAIPFIKPRALYLGTNISLDNAIKLSEICEYKSIEMYKMVLDDEGSNRNIKAVPYI